MPSIGPWIQPDDVDNSVILTRWHWTQHDPPGGAYLLLYWTLEQARAFEIISGDQRFETICPVASPDVCTAPIVVPTFPPGATSVEYEATEGVLLRARLHGSLRNAATSGTPSAGVWEIPEADLDPGQDTADSSGHIGPTFDTAGGTAVFLTSTVDTIVGSDWTVQEFQTPYQDFPASLRVGWKLSSTAGAFETGVAYPDDFVTDFWGVPSNPAVPRWGSANRYIEYTYRPPRYRFTFSGRTPLRGRQRASGVIGSTPLRGRQGDLWGLRGRQNSNL